MSTQQGYNKRVAESSGRFFGNGNVWLGPVGGLRGWQVMCCRCRKRSKTLSTRKGDGATAPFHFYRKFTASGWKIGNAENADVCAECLKTDRQAFFASQEHERNAKKLAHLHGLITSLDQFINENVALFSCQAGRDEKLALIEEMGSLLTSAFCLNLLPAQWKEHHEAPEPEPPPLEERPASAEELAKAYAQGRADLLKSQSQVSPLRKSLVQRFEEASQPDRTEFWTYLRRHCDEAEKMHQAEMQRMADQRAVYKSDELVALPDGSIVPFNREAFERAMEAENGTPKPPGEPPRPMPPPTPEPPRPSPSAAMEENAPSASAVQHIARMRAQLNGHGGTKH